MALRPANKAGFRIEDAHTMFAVNWPPARAAIVIERRACDT